MMESSDSESSGGSFDTVSALILLWQKRMNQVDVVEADLHEAILNYFIVNGNQEAAQAFVEESGMFPESRHAEPCLPSQHALPLQKIGTRAAIREALFASKIEEAITLLDELSPEILLSRPDIHFTLLRRLFVQKLESNMGEALVFSQEKLSPFISEYPDMNFLPELEEVMALMVFPMNDKKALQDVINNIPGFANADLHKRVDSAILEYYRIGQISKLDFICKNVIWSQKNLEVTINPETLEEITIKEKIT